MNREFFERSVHVVASDLIGCRIAVGEAAGIIVETEAYEASDPACHAYIGRTARNEVLFGPPGRAYVYLSYGIHSLLNFVTEPEGTASAVLIRALEPTDGIELMRERRSLNARARASATRLGLEELCSGPGKLTAALGVGLSLNGADLLSPPFELLERREGWNGARIVTSERIGITKAADLPWRYSAAGSRYVSKPWPSNGRRQASTAATNTAAGPPATSRRAT
jgi:DNA-3-methyladenine glycosylase